MENFGHRLLVILSVILSVRGDTVHLTMVSPTPYGAGSSASISCFRSSPDEDVTLSFGRPFQIGLHRSSVQTSTTLPDGSTQSVNGQVVTQDLTSSNNATGLFYCEGSNRNLTTRVYSIIHSIHRRFQPGDGQVTRTVNKGENVTLSVIPVNSGGTPLWRRTNDGVVDFMSASGLDTLTVSSADVVHGDLYTVIASAVGLENNHFSMIRLIVRGCAAGKWGPACVELCDMCYNGGVCDDKTGDCICPPGFSGPNCLTACGMHKFGWNCEFDCASPPFSCTGQFGLPDPYGNSCISGYMGAYCSNRCPSGRFGAGCTQTCRCRAGGEACDRFTGECALSGCQDGLSGTSCQISGTCSTGMYGLDCLSNCHCANNAACVRDSGYCSGSNGACADGFKSDVNANNCQTGIIEFQMLTMPNQGQVVNFSCAATSGDVLTADSLMLSGSATYTSTMREGNVLNNTFTMSGLSDNQQIICYLLRNGGNVHVVQTLTVSLFVPPYLSQPPTVMAGPLSATVSWQAWGSDILDFGDGPVIKYIVYYNQVQSGLSSGGEVQVTDLSQVEYSFVVQPLAPSTQYQFSVSAVRDGQGGGGPRSPTSAWIYPLATPPPTTEGPAITESSTGRLTPVVTTVEGLTTLVDLTSPSHDPNSPVSVDSTTVSTATNPTPMSLVGVVVPVVIVLVLLLILVILLIVLVKRIRDKKHAEVDGGSSMQGKFESSNDSSLQTIDNPISIPMEDINSNPNGDVVPAMTLAVRPESSVSQISTLDSSSPFAGLPLYPTRERELKKDPIPLKDFVAYVRQAIQGHHLRDEWSSFPGIEAICSCDVSQLPDNKMKNRYRNIPAYDHCRVILEHEKEDPNLGYINACYIKGYKNDKAYIATQGPNQATSHDFWKMVWQENVRIIVNGTNLVEDGKNKCAKYWPDMEQLETFGGISISLVKDETRGEYRVRTMIIAKIGDSKATPRTIRQFHYTSWPDKDVPKDVTPVLRLIKDFSDATPEGAGPYLIHCSAGVGRTGAIIAIHALLQQAHAEKTLDIYNFVADMRDHRVSIVQTPVQYIFVHLALLEALFSGDTCIPSSSLKKRVAELKKKKKMAEEFEQLNTISPVPIAERCRSSVMESNHNKNRLPSALVPESCRPFLMTPREDGMEYNYINAAFVDVRLNLWTGYLLKERVLFVIDSLK
ncbi:uncharacterized protein LOC110989392 isoform X2 [Acanthaster planci]|uniref:protein-tyrosine-phosphatase n=1 Tax=Acanthaster planci TaxID=133434 RepID=A0A8B8A0T2_ACAPL|nr:uncharacterized protein LOC110989392 isoform X2 [Acanthaster planci]